MGKITVTLSDQTEKQLRTYVTQKYPEQPFGKLSEIVEKALTEFLEKAQGA
jgi:hypothetical protein